MIQTATAALSANERASIPMDVVRGRTAKIRPAATAVLALVVDATRTTSPAAADATAIAESDRVANSDSPNTPTQSFTRE